MRHPDSEPCLLTSVKPFLRDAYTLGEERKIIALKIRALGQAWQTQIYSEIIDVASVSSDCVDTVFECSRAELPVRSHCYPEGLKHKFK